MSLYDGFKILLILLILLGVMYGLFYIVRKFMLSGVPRYKKMNMQVLSAQTLMPRKYVVAVKIKDKIYILGVSDNSINCLDSYKDDSPEEENDLVQEKKPFWEQLKQSVTKK